MGVVSSRGRLQGNGSCSWGGTIAKPIEDWAVGHCVCGSAERGVEQPLSASTESFEHGRGSEETSSRIGDRVGTEDWLVAIPGNQTCCYGRVVTESNSVGIES